MARLTIQSLARRDVERERVLILPFRIISSFINVESLIVKSTGGSLRAEDTGSLSEFLARESITAELISKTREIEVQR